MEGKWGIHGDHLLTASSWPRWVLKTPNDFFSHLGVSQAKYKGLVLHGTHSFLLAHHQQLVPCKTWFWVAVGTRCLFKYGMWSRSHSALLSLCIWGRSPSTQTQSRPHLCTPTWALPHLCKHPQRCTTTVSYPTLVSTYDNILLFLSQRWCLCESLSVPPLSVTFIPPHHLYHQHLRLRLKCSLYPTMIVFETLLLPVVSQTPREVPICDVQKSKYVIGKLLCDIWHSQDILNTFLMTSHATVTGGWQATHPTYHQTHNYCLRFQSCYWTTLTFACVLVCEPHHLIRLFTHFRHQSRNHMHEQVVMGPLVRQMSIWGEESSSDTTTHWLRNPRLYFNYTNVIFSCK
jgi:hypothetical protein